jgi:hypothetical protein
VAPQDTSAFARPCNGMKRPIPKIMGRGGIRSQLICDELVRDKAIFLQQLAKDLPGRAPASSAVVTTAAYFAMTMSSSIACTSASGSAQQSRTTTNR